MMERKRGKWKEGKKKKTTKYNKREEWKRIRKG